MLDDLVVVRSCGDDNGSLLALASLVPSLCGMGLVYVDGSERGITARVNDALSAARLVAEKVIVLRTTKSKHSRTLWEGLDLALSMDFDRLHHFDEDVIVAPSWFAQNWPRDAIASMQVCEIDALKGYRSTTPGPCDHVSAHAFTVTKTVLVDADPHRLLNHKLGVFEDVLLCARTPCVVLPGVGVWHATRDTGGGYMRAVLEDYERRFKG